MQKFREVIQDRAGNAVVGAQVRVQTYPGAVDATIYSDDGVTLTTNPLTTGANGEFSFYAADGEYQLVVTGTGFTTRTVTDIQLEDVEDASAGVFTTISVSGDSTLTGDVTIGGTLGVTGVATFSGQIRAADGSAAAPAYAFSGEASTGMYRAAADDLRLVTTGLAKLRLVGSQAILASNVAFQWGTGGSTGISSPDLSLVRDAANILAQRNGVNAQGFRIYNTFTDAANYERLFAGFSGNTAYVQQESAGTGVARRLRLSGVDVSLMSSGTDRWLVNTAGVLKPWLSNTYDIGAPSELVKSIYWGTQALGPQGSLASPAYSFADDSDSGFYNNTASARLSLARNGIWIYSVDATGPAGSVGHTF